MLANHEHRIYANNSLVWTGKYHNLKNISHWHFDHEIVSCHSGKAIILIDQTSYELLPKQCIYIRGQSVHSIQSEENTTLYVTLFSEKLLNRITDNYCLISPLFVDHFKVAETQEKIRIADFERKIFYDEYCNTLMQDLIITLFTQLKIKEDQIVQSRTTEQYKKLLYDIDEDIENYSFEKAVDYMNMSEAYFSRYFRKISGMTFSQYLNHIRINKAIDLIKKEDLSITQISLKCGFDTIRNFNRVFKQITGYTPKKLPEGYILNLRSNSSNSQFDPTLTSSELMIE